MFDELSTVTLTHDIAAHNLYRGDVGIIVHVYGNGEAYEVEFINSLGGTVSVLTLNLTDIRPIEINSTKSWVEPVWVGFEPTPSIENNADEAETRMFYSQL